jgi:hypothetical protein
MGKGRQRQTPPVEKVSPALQGAWRFFESGDTVMARKEAKRILASPPSEADAAQARELLARTRIPGLAFIIAGAVVFLASMLVLIALTRV